MRHHAFAEHGRRRVLVAGLCSWLCATPPTFAATETAVQPAAIEPAAMRSETFGEKSIGLILGEAPDGRVQVAKIQANTPAADRGILPLSVLVDVNGSPVTGLTLEEATTLVRKAQRPVTVRFDMSAYAGLDARDALERASDAQGFETGRVKLRRLSSDDAIKSCGMATRESDAIEVEYVGRLQNGAIFDDTRSRGRPFALLLGSGDVVKGLDGSFAVISVRAAAAACAARRHRGRGTCE